VRAPDVRSAPDIQLGSGSAQQLPVTRGAAGHFTAGVAWLRSVVTGVALAIGVALLARLTARWLLPSVVSEVALALVLGLLIAARWELPAATGPGLRLASQRILKFGIVLLGARLLLSDVAAVGLGVLGLVLLCMSVALGVALLIGRALGLPPRLALLIGVGTAVCGNSAIVATAPVVGAEEREVGFAVATITLFGTLAVVVYPLIGHALGLGDAPFGTWAGVAVNDTSQVVATGAAFSPAARDVATVVKLLRNTLMAPLILIIAWRWGAGHDAAARRGARHAVPPFVLGFLAVALARTLGLIPVPAVAALDEIARACIVIALAAVGLTIRVGRLRAMGAAPFWLGLGTSSVLAILALTLIVTAGLGTGR
jgi:uncharacterized integral membrane protein (TIGR00698 family)